MGILEVQVKTGSSLLAQDTRTHSAFSTCQITGFFTIHDRYRDPVRTGSTGAGVNLQQGVTTSVQARESSRNELSVRLNDRLLANPVVSRQVVDEYVNRSQNKWRITVTHQCRLPVGAGYGTSGAGAASLSLALNEALGDPLGRIDALQIAHAADVKMKTGLGTVASVSVGGLAVRVKPGAPGVGKVKKLAASADLRVISGSFGPLSKPRILSDTTLTQRINHCSRGMTRALLRSPQTSRFVSLSRKFSDCLGLASPRVRRLFEVLDGRGVNASMMMLGDGAFSIVPRGMVGSVARLFENAGMSSVTSRIGRRGAYLL